MPVAPSQKRSAARSWRAAALAAMVLLLALTWPAVAVTGPTKLLDPSVTPSSATPTVTISFAVTYRNREGSPPDYVRVVIDDVAHEMTGSGDAWKAGVRFTFARKLPLGSHAVRFEAQDRDKFTDAIDGGTVVIAWPPSPTPTPTPKPTPAPTPTPTPSPTSSPGETAPSSTPSPGSSGTPGSTDDPGAGGNTGASSGSSDSPAAGPRRAGARSGTESSPGTTDGPSSPGSGDGTSGAGGATGSGGAGGSASGFDPNDPWVAGGPDGPAPWALTNLDGSPAGPDNSTGSPGSVSDPDGELNGPLDLWRRAGQPVAAAGAQRTFAAALTSLGLDGGGIASLPGVTVAVTTSGAVAIWMGFLVFGKRRRDGEPPDSDEALAVGAARAGDGAASSHLITAPVTVPAVHDPEAGIPRWRRQSLLEARRADPLRAPAVVPPSQTFSRGIADRNEASERRVIRFRLVRLLDAPDEFRASEIGVLDQGDEVELIESSGVYRLVRCPDGGQGWIHKMTLGDVVGETRALAHAGHWASGSNGTGDLESDGSIIGSMFAGRSGA